MPTTLPIPKTVLVVEDNPSISKAIGRLLRLRRFETVLFNSAESVRHYGKFDQACCVILDANLGDGSGIELRRWLAYSGVTVPVIFITGQDAPATRAAAIQSECIAFLSKPFSAKSLIEAIEKAFDRPVNGAIRRGRTPPDAG
jgi:FixJ family two-component response regulator